MKDGIGGSKLRLLWIHWSDHIISFHEEDGYERKEFSTIEEQMDYVFGKTANGFRIQ